MATSPKDLEHLYSNNVKQLYKFFYYKTLNKHIAQDLTSETFLRFAENIRTEKILNDRAFLYGIAKNVFTDYLKQKYKGEVVISDELLDFYSYAQDFVSSTSNLVKLEDLVIKLLPQVPKRQREILTLRLVEKYSLKEVCEKLNKSESYVKTTQNRAIKSLKRLIELDNLI